MDVKLTEKCGHIEKVAVDRGELIPETSKTGGGCLERLGITVDSVEMGSGGEALQNRFGVSAAAERAVHKYAAPFGLQICEDFIQHDGNMLECHTPICDRCASASP